MYDKIHYKLKKMEKKRHNDRKLKKKKKTDNKWEQTG